MASAKLKKILKPIIISISSLAVAFGLFIGVVYFYHLVIELACDVLTGLDLPDGSFEKLSEKDREIASFILDEVGIRYRFSDDGTMLCVSDIDAEKTYLIFSICSYEWDGQLCRYGDTQIPSFDSET